MRLNSAKVKKLKGFTLVEMIVVLVIIAILASLSIGAFTGYIDKSKDRMAVLEARRWYIAAQGALTEAYGYDNINMQSTDTGNENILSLAEGKITSNCFAAIQNSPNAAQTGDNKTAKLILQYMDSLKTPKSGNDFVFNYETYLASSSSPDTYFSGSEANEYSVVISYSSKGKINKLEYAKKGYPDVIVVGPNGYNIVPTGSSSLTNSRK